MKLYARQQYDQQSEEIEREATAIDNFDEGFTLQAPAVDADINVLVKRAGITDGSRIFPIITDTSGYYGDFSNVPDFRAALDIQRDAEKKFGELPASLRRKFNNDPLELWNYLQDPKNADEAVQIGLLQRTQLENGTAPNPPAGSGTSGSPATPPAT